MNTITKNTLVENIKKMAPACRCKACEHGCRMGSGFLAKGDEEKLAKMLGVSVDELKEKFLEEADMFNTKMLRPKILRENGKQYGRCTFFDEKRGCTVHEAKPLQCAVSMGCKPYGSQLITWFVLNNAVIPNDPESVRQYATYLEAEGEVISGGKLEEVVPDAELRKKMLDFTILK